MKRIISAALAGVLVFAVSAPAFATTASFLTGSTGFCNFDFEDETAKTDLKTYLTTANTGHSFNSGDIPTVEYDAEKGSNVMIFKGSQAVWDGITFAGKETGIKAGDTVYFEFSFKQTAKTTMILTAGQNFRFFSVSKGDELITWTSETQGKLAYELNKWYHIVLKVEVGETTGYMTPYINGVAYPRLDNSNYKAANMATFGSGARLQVNTDATNKTYVDDFKIWIGGTDYTPEATGDVAKITSTELTVGKDNVILYEGLSTLAELNAKLTAENGGSIVYFDASNNLISDLAGTSISPETKIVVRSASGAAVDRYTAVMPDVTSDEYTIDFETKKISGVPYMTKTADFLANLNVKEGLSKSVSTNAYGYVDKNSTVTIGSVNYTVENETYFETDFTNEGDSTLGAKGFGSAGLAYVASQAWCSVDNGAVKGGKSLVEKFNEGGIHHYDFVPSTVFPDGLEAGDVVNFEFNVLTTAKSSAVCFTLGGLRVFKFTDDGKIVTYNETVTLNEGYKLGEWNHVVVSWAKDNFTDERGTIYSTYKIYLNGKELEKENGVTDFTNSAMKESNQFRISLGTTDAGSCYLDDVKIYKSAKFGYDEAYMSGGELLASDSYIISDKVIYLKDGVTVADAMGELPFASNPLDAEGEIVNPDEMSVGSVFYIAENKDSTTGATRVSKYTFASADKLTANGDKLSAAVYGDGMIVAAAYDGDGKMTDVKVFKVSDKKTTVDLKDFTGTTVKAFLWSDSLVPYNMLTKGADEWN